MNRIMSVCGLIAVAAWLMPGGASAVIIGTNYEITYVGDSPWNNFLPSSGGTGTFSCALNSGVETCTVDKTFTAIGDIPIIIDTKPNTDQSLLSGFDLIHIDESVTNNTGIDWTDFHFGFADIDNGPMTIDFQNIVQSGAFSVVSASTDALDLIGSVANNASFDISFDLMINTRPGDYDLFAVTEQPSVPTVPEPETLALFGIGLVGLRLMQRKRAV